ncbi:MAG: hypothetical protein ACRD44_13990 [Bryobacteraceae bacterium]
MSPLPPQELAEHVQFQVSLLKLLTRPFESQAESRQLEELTTLVRRD